MPDTIASPAIAPFAEGDALPQWRRFAIFGLLVVSEFLYGWAWNSVDVLRPFLRDSLNLSLLQAGSTYSAQGGGALIGAILIGQLADRFGRRLMLSVLIFGYGVMLLLGNAVGSYPGLLAQRFLLGLFMGGAFPVSVGIYVTLFSPRVRGLLAGTLYGFFGFSIVALGLAVGLLGNRDWHLLLWVGGVPPLFLAALVLVVIPKVSAIDRFHVTRTKLPVSELFHRGVRRQTLLLAAMTGLNFFGYQAYSGWLTTYLTSVRGLSPAVSGELVAWQFAGNIFGGFAWGWAADRFGRRTNAYGFVIAAIAIAVFLSVPTDFTLLSTIGFVYGAALSASVIWGPWLAELYPPHLRSTAASIFNWGRVISFFAPLVTATVASRFGLSAAMLLASVSFGIAAVIWLMQRETLDRSAHIHSSS